MFSCGTVYAGFTDAFCCRCSKYRLDKDMIPTNGSCEIEKKLNSCYFSGEGFPYEHLIKGGQCQYICKEFNTDDEGLMESYKELVRENTETK